MCSASVLSPRTLLPTPSGHAARSFGYRIIRAIGVKLAKITPSRGFCIEMGSALVVVTGSYLELPLSTTHCQVGGTVAVGLLEGTKGVGWMVVLKSAIGWVFTLILVGFLSALLMALGIFTPNLRDAEAMVAMRDSLSEIGNGQITQLREAPGCASNQLFLVRLLLVLLQPCSRPSPASCAAPRRSGRCTLLQRSLLHAPARVERRWRGGR